MKTGSIAASSAYMPAINHNLTLEADDFRFGRFISLLHLFFHCRFLLSVLLFRLSVGKQQGTAFPRRPPDEMQGTAAVLPAGVPCDDAHTIDEVQEILPVDLPLVAVKALHHGKHPVLRHDLALFISVSPDQPAAVTCGTDGPVQDQLISLPIQTHVVSSQLSCPGKQHCGVPIRPDHGPHASGNGRHDQKSLLPQHFLMRRVSSPPIRQSDACFPPGPLPPKVSCTDWKQVFSFSYVG